MRLDLAENKLRGTIPATLGSLSELRHLYLARNDLTGSIPAALGSLSNLQQLDLLHNDLTGSIPTALGNLSELRHLDLMGNDLTGSIPNQLGNLSKLTELLLGTNQLSGTIPPVLSSLSNLSILRLDYNDLTGSIPASLVDIGHLFYLGLSHNNFSGCEPAGLRALASHHDLADLGLPRCSSATSTPIATVNSLTLTSNQPGVLLVTWDAPADTPDDYRVVWAKTGESFPPYTGNVGNAYPTSPPYSITGLEHGARYKVKVRARYAGRGAEWTDVVRATVMAAPAAIDTPLPTATNTPLPTATNTPLPTATNTPAANCNQHASANGNQHASANGNQHASANGNQHASANGNQLASEPPLGRPQNLTASANTDGISLSWDASAGQVDGYEILRRRPHLGEDTFQTLVADTGSSATTYTDTTATESTRYNYRVKAIRNGEKSSRSDRARVDR